MPVHGNPPRRLERTARRPAAARPKPNSLRLAWVLAAFLLPALLLLGLVFGIGFGWSSSMTRPDSGAAHARWTLVLDGWVPQGERAARGADLARTRRTDSVLISGSQVAPGVWASLFQLRALAPDTSLSGRLGELRHDANSTAEEVRVATAFFRSRGVDTVFLVTSDYHTDRAASIAERVAQGKPVYLAVPASEARFAKGWTRERWKTWLLESTKRLTWFGFERWRTRPLQTGDSLPTAWSVALGPEAGQSSLFQAPAAPAPVCPPPVVCPVCPAAPVAVAPEAPVAEPPPKPKAADRKEAPVARASAKPEKKPEAKKPDAKKPDKKPEAKAKPEKKTGKK